MTRTTAPASFMGTRRAFLTALAALSGSAAYGLSVARSTHEKLRVNAGRLQRTLEELSVFGRPAGGTFADGVSRIAYSDADVAGRKYVMDLMRSAGLDPKKDAAGNICATRAGSQGALKPIVFGSHTDSVPSGGNFDGDVGSLSAIEVIQTLQDAGVRTRHPLEVCIWSNEEGGTVGSHSVAGDLDPKTLDLQFNGILMRSGLAKIGGDPARLAEVRRLPGSMHCYLELHIEQGGTLEKAAIPIGIVDGIVSIHQYAVEIRGFANHAGTTPMAERHNALLAAAKLIEAVQDEVTKMPGRQVGTVGQLTVFPNAPNIVPGLVKHTIEFRDLSEDTLLKLGEAAKKRAQEIAAATGTEITLTQIERLRPALATPDIQKQIEGAASALGLKTMHLPSGAGHDAQNIAQIAPMGMIFVPSIGGISHSPRERSSWEDCANGANVLLQTVLRLDRT
jgi:beta-ureidopropionase / N-carbamoyl-L-amino-acid hydrolase